MVEVYILQQLFLQTVVVLSMIRVDASIHIECIDMMEPVLIQHPDDRRTGRSAAADDNLLIFRLCFLQPHAVNQSRKHDNRSAMLVVVEDRNRAFLNQAALNLHAARSADVFQVDCSETRRNCFADGYDFIRILGIQADRPGIDAGKPLHQKCFAFHDRKACRRADIAEAKHCSSIGHNRNRIAAIGIEVGFLRIFLDFQAWLGNTRRVGNAQILSILTRNFRFHRQFSMMCCMQFQSFLIVIHSFPSSILYHRCI